MQHELKCKMQLIKNFFVNADKRIIQTQIVFHFDLTSVTTNSHKYFDGSHPELFINHLNVLWRKDISLVYAFAFTVSNGFEYRLNRLHTKLLPGAGNVMFISILLNKIYILIYVTRKQPLKFFLS